MSSEKTKDASPSSKKAASSTSAADAKKEKKSKAGGDALDDEVKALIKAGVWKELKQESTGKTYYSNAKTKQTVWDLKKHLEKEKAAASAAPAATSPAAAEKPAAKADETAATEASSKKSVVASMASKLSSAASQVTAAAKSQGDSDARSMASTGNQQNTDQKASSEAEEAAALQQQQQSGAASAATPAAGGLRDLHKYTDPLERLMTENNMLQQLLVTGSHGQVALDFQAKHDALLRTNNALTVQMGRMKTEYDAMQRALVEANLKIHQQQLQLAERVNVTQRTKDEELQMTMAHLREQNRVLVTQVSELSILLARGLNEVAYRDAPRKGAPLVIAETTSEVIDRLFETPAKQVLCSTCLASLGMFRDSTLKPNESNVGALSNGAMDSAARSNVSHASYTNLTDLTYMPSAAGSNGATAQQRLAPHHHGHQSQQQASSGGAPFHTGSAMPSATAGFPSSHSPVVARQVLANAPAPVMYGGFLVRNARSQ